MFSFSCKCTYRAGIGYRIIYILSIPLLILQVALDLKNEATSQVKMMNESVSKVYCTLYICVLGYLLECSQRVVVQW